MTKHATLSASSSSRWLACPPSARLAERYEDAGSDYAAEGTDAHTLCEYRLKAALGMKSKDPTGDLTYYSPEMEDCAGGYVSYVLELIEAAKKTCADPVVLIEQRLDYSRWAREGFGTGDCIVIGDGTLHIVDYKHGQGVRVESEGNPQMMLYALGALEIFDPLYDIREVAMTVYQPRRDNVSTWKVPKGGLYLWAEDVLVPGAALAYAGEGEFKCGEWCRFCKAKAECRARAEANLELARYDFRMPPLLDDDEIGAILGQIDELAAWASDVKEYALQQALSGKQWSGWKLVAGRSNRRYISEDAVAETVSAAGYDPYEHKVLGITAMEKTLGKSKFTEMLGSLVEKPAGKPVLVPEGDKRPAINTDAKSDFTEVKENE
jgi:hypothetical protein